MRLDDDSSKQGVQHASQLSAYSHISALRNTDYQTRSEYVMRVSNNKLAWQTDNKK